jgi:glycine oxidase
MPQEASSSHARSSVIVIGAGIAGSWQALLFARAEYSVTLLDRDESVMTQAASHWAGGMLAPWCEQETSEPIITHLGARSLDLWRTELPETPFNGTIVVAHPRDRPDLERFARLTVEHKASRRCRRD